MFPRNAATPPEVDLGQILQLSDGAIQTTGASVRVKIGTGAWGAGAGTLSCDATSGIWTYAPTQTETNADYFIVGVYKASCSALSKTVITSASTTSGYAGLDWAKVIAATTTVNLSGTSVKTATDVETDTQDIQSRLPAALVSGRIDASVGAIANNAITAASIAADAITDAKVASDVTIASVTGAVGSVTGNVGGNVIGSVGSVVAGVTVSTNNDKTGYSLTQAFPSNFSSLAITGGGAVTVGTNNDKTGYALTQSFPSNFASMNLDVSGRVLLQPTQTGVTIPSVTTVASVSGAVASVTNAVTVGSMNSNVLTASALASDAASEVASAVRTELATELGRIDVASSTRASQSSVDGKPTLLQIEGSTVLAKEATVATRSSQSSVDGKPTLAQIEASTVLAKDATVAKEATLTNRPTLGQIEASTVLAKEATVNSVGSTVTTISSNVTTLLGRITSGVATMFLDLVQMITGSGTVNAKFTTKALEDGAAGNVNISVLPLTADQEQRNTRSRIIVYTGEGGTQHFFAKDGQGNNLNLTGLNLELRFAKGKAVIYTAKTSDGSLTVSNNNQVTFTRSAALTRGDGELTYALRNMGAGEEVLLDGPVTVRYAP